MANNIHLDDLISKSVQNFGINRFDFSKFIYINSRTKGIIICNVCKNEFEQSSANHKFGFDGCKNCSLAKRSNILRLTHDELIARFKDKHGNKYNYDKVKYHKYRDKVLINCPFHGEFSQYAHLHYNGTECPQCARYKTSRFGSMSNVKLNTEMVHLYVIEFTSDKYQFIKIGVTSRSIEARFLPVSYRNYTKNVLLDLKLECKLAVDIESAIMLQFYNYRYYLPSNDAFKGCTELFKLSQSDAIIAEISKLIKGHSVGDNTTVYNFYAGSPRKVIELQSGAKARA